MKPTSLRGPFAGMNRQWDPGGMRDGQFWEIVNGRLSARGVVLVNRGGQAKVNSGAVVSGCPEFVFDGGDTGA